jgi:DNA ligase (NAD+)
MNSKIKDYLDAASEAYYNGSPFISDEVFDRLADSINYQAVGAKSHEDVENHYFPMFSLQKFYEGEGKNPLAGCTGLSISPKLDGAAISILYIDGELTRVLTRGDGIEGRVVTDKFLATNHIPHKVRLMGVVQVTGELCAPKHIENARNYAAGSLNLKDVDEFRTRAVEFFAYGIQPYQSNTFEEDMVILKKLGFNTVKDGKGELDKIYPCDGVVFRINDYDTFTDQGFTSKHPRGAYALKERSEGVETILIDVEWQVGKSGKVTPVAILEPVLIGDALVSRATLNNPGFIESLDLMIGDRVAIVRSGEVIPCILHKVEG